MRRSFVSPRLAGFLAPLLVLVMVAPVFGYVSYRAGDNGCSQCHDGFQHGLHVGDNAMTSNCFLCHFEIGDNPIIGASGDGVGCSGCHAAPGLLAHHAAVGAPPDNLGRFCATCHVGNPAPPPEDTLPPYYSRDDVRINDPCLVASADGGEDWDDDGRGLDNDGNLLYEGDDPACSATAAPAALAGFRLLPCRPNPFNPSTLVRFVLPEAATVRLEVFDLDGRRVAGLAEGFRPAGLNEIAWQGRDDRGNTLPSGIYVCRIEAGRHRAATRMVLLK